MSFIEGYSKAFYDNIIGLPAHTKEEIAWRLTKCQHDCVKTGKCKVCGCVTWGKILVKKSCNSGERFPDLRSKKEWEEFKKTLDDKDDIQKG